MLLFIEFSLDYLRWDCFAKLLRFGEGGGGFSSPMNIPESVDLTIFWMKKKCKFKK
jgi:hypothetical protein